MLQRRQKGNPFENIFYDAAPSLKRILMALDKKGVRSSSGPAKHDPTKFGSQMVVGSVTRLGDLLDFGQLFKAFGKN